jgi:hypothetical protein
MPTHTELLGDEYHYVHQISFCEGLYIANTDFNCMDYINQQTREHQRYHFDGYKKDVNHVNSVFPFDVNMVASLLHNHGRDYSEVAILHRAHEKGFEIIRRLPLWDLGAHNIWFDGDYLLYNASYVGDLVIVDLDREQVISRIHFPGHTKGLSVTDEYYVVGYSEFAKRDERKTSRGYIGVIDRESLEIVARVDLNLPSLPHPVGNVNEVRCLSKLDFGHADFVERRIDWNHLELSRQDRMRAVKVRSRRMMAKLEKVWLKVLYGQLRSS